MDEKSIERACIEETRRALQSVRPAEAMNAKSYVRQAGKDTSAGSDRDFNMAPGGTEQLLGQALVAVVGWLVSHVLKDAFAEGAKKAGEELGKQLVSATLARLRGQELPPPEPVAEETFVVWAAANLRRGGLAEAESLEVARSLWARGPEIRQQVLGTS